MLYDMDAIQVYSNTNEHIRAIRALSCSLHVILFPFVLSLLPLDKMKCSILTRA